MARQNRFSLSDLLMVLAVVVVIAAIVIPSLLRPEMAANEAAAVNSLRVINAAEITYAATRPDFGFACTLTALASGASQTATPMDPALASGAKKGYLFSIFGCSGVPATSYVVVAQPAMPNKTGVRVFCSDQTGIVRFTPDSRLGCTTLSRLVE
jgi:type II secretory pathway pseudopilin PulG